MTEEGARGTGSVVEQARRIAQLKAETVQLKAEVGRLSHLAHTDALTGLPNRRALQETLGRELARAVRERQPLCLAMLDLDHFKVVNDTHGHLRGDQVLGQAAAAWRKELRAEDLLARDHGDEFAAVLPNCSLEKASEVIDRLRTATPEGQTCSAGVVCWDGREPAEVLIARADRTLYAAKQAGRNLAIASDGITTVDLRSGRKHRDGQAGGG